jgi:hypothetical protein
MRVRAYRLQPGGGVNCTIAPEDDLVIAHLHTPLTGVRRLDLVLDDVKSGAHWRAEDVAFDPAADEVVMAPNSSRNTKNGYSWDSFPPGQWTSFGTMRNLSSGNAGEKSTW